MADYKIWCDGGCLGNPGKMYGSYLIVNGNNKYLQRLKFGHGTNNQSEYLALIFSLTDLISKIKNNNNLPIDFSVCIFSDSQLMTKQVNGEWSCGDPSLAKLKKQTVGLISQFRDVSIIWKPRQEIVKILGH